VPGYAAFALPLHCPVIIFVEWRVPPSGRTYHVVPAVGGGAAAKVIVETADFVCTGALLSVTVTVKVDIPLAVGVPEIVPVADPSVSPAGRLPEVMDQVYGWVPPLAVRVCE
jgi:hypothetical protein